MSFLRRLFGGGAAAAPARPAAVAEHKGYRIEAWPEPEGGQYRLAGLISREVEGVRREHRLIRADLFPVERDAVEATLAKARQVIDEQGDRLFP